MIRGKTIFRSVMFLACFVFLHEIGAKEKVFLFPPSGNEVASSAFFSALKLSLSKYSKRVDIIPQRDCSSESCAYKIAESSGASGIILGMIVGEEPEWMVKLSLLATKSRTMLGQRVCMGEVGLTEMIARCAEETAEGIVSAFPSLEKQESVAALPAAPVVVTKQIPLQQAGLVAPVIAENKESEEAPESEVDSDRAGAPLSFPSVVAEQKNQRWHAENDVKHIRILDSSGFWRTVPLFSSNLFGLPLRPRSNSIRNYIQPDYSTGKISGYGYGMLDKARKREVLYGRLLHLSLNHAVRNSESPYEWLLKESAKTQGFELDLIRWKRLEIARKKSAFLIGGIGLLASYIVLLASLVPDDPCGLYDEKNCSDQSSPSLWTPMAAGGMVGSIVYAIYHFKSPSREEREIMKSIQKRRSR